DDEANRALFDVHRFDNSVIGPNPCCKIQIARSRCPHFGQGGNQMTERSKAGLGHLTLQFALLLYLLLPLVATGVYAFAKDWQDSVLPKQWTMDWFSGMFDDTRFIEALWTSLSLCAISVGLSLVVMLPAVFVLTVYYPRWESLMRGIVVLPYA